MRILITGVAGFLGSHLAERLIKSNHDVIGIDNLYTGSKLNLLDLTNHRNFKFYEADVTNKLKFKVDAIVNMACPASPVHYQKNPVQTTRTNFLGILNCLDLANELDIPVLQSSTSEVYGDPNISPQSENYWGNVNPIGIRSCYDEGKRVAETLMFDYHRQYETKIKIARIFNTYGPKMELNDGRVVSNFIVQAIKGEPITIFGEGTQTRSFCYVSDTVSAIEKFLFADISITGPINIGNPAELNMLDLAEKIIELTASESKIIKLNLPQDDPKQRKPDIKLAKSVLNWQPKISLLEGLNLTIKDFKGRITKK
jgi:UDP-glucuronate decarboxylase